VRLALREDLLLLNVGTAQLCSVAAASAIHLSVGASTAPLPLLFRASSSAIRRHKRGDLRLHAACILSAVIDHYSQPSNLVRALSGPRPSSEVMQTASSSTMRQISGLAVADAGCLHMMGCHCSGKEVEGRGNPGCARWFWSSKAGSHFARPIQRKVPQG
jgi:hypothetical protein